MALMAFARKDCSKFLLQCRLILSIPTASVFRRSLCILPTQVHKPHKPNFVRPSCVLSSERHISSFHRGHPFLDLSLKLSTMLTMINDCQSIEVMGIIYQNLDMLKKLEVYLKVVGNVTKDKLLVDKVEKLPPDVARKLFTALMVMELRAVAEILGLDKRIGADKNAAECGRGRGMGWGGVGNKFRNAAGINISICSMHISIGSIHIYNSSSINIVVK